MRQKEHQYNLTAVGERIRVRMEKLGIPRQGVAGLIGKAEKYYADIERGYCGMSMDTMLEIAECLGISLDYMIWGKADDGELPEDLRSLLSYLQNCDEKKRKKTVKILQIYLSD